MVYKADIELIKMFGAKVKKYRLEQNITQAQLAFESGMPREQIYRIEKGQVNISLKKVDAIAQALNIHPKELFEF